MPVLDCMRLSAGPPSTTAFATVLLNGRRAECLRLLDAPLDAEESQAVLAIEASGMVEFSVAIQQLIEQGRGRAVPRPAEPAVFQRVRWPSPVSSGVFMLHE